LSFNEENIKGHGEIFEIFYLPEEESSSYDYIDFSVDLKETDVIAYSKDELIKIFDIFLIFLIWLNILNLHTKNNKPSICIFKLYLIYFLIYFFI